MGTADLSVMFMEIILCQLTINCFSIIASTSRENGRPLTEKELQMEADSKWENEAENDIDEDIFGGADTDEDYVEEHVSDTDSKQSENKDEIIVDQSVKKYFEITREKWSLLEHRSIIKTRPYKTGKHCLIFTWPQRRSQNSLIS